ncbi:MAG: CHASE3 domain-containing protein [Dongiaceae bacterium]
MDQVEAIGIGGEADRAAAATPASGGAALPGRAALLMAGGFLVLLAIGAIGLVFAARTRAYTAELAQAGEVQGRLSLLLSLVQDAETGQRGYLLTGDDLYLKPYDEAAAAVRQTLAGLDAMLQGEPRQAATLAALKPAVTAKLDELKATVDRRAAGDVAGALAIVRTDRGERLMDRIREGLRGLGSAENDRLAARAAEARAASGWLIAASLAGIPLIVLLAGGAILMSRRAAAALAAAHRGLAAANESLEAAVAERTAELRDANEEIQRFAYIVSHDLRSPLVNVMGFTSELEAIRTALGRPLATLREVAPERVDEAGLLEAEKDFAEAIDFIKLSTAKMDRLIAAILKLSREGRRSFAPERLDMTRLVGGLASALSHQAGEAGAEIAVGPLPPLTSDRLAMEQIFGNLLDNAVKYLAPGRPGRIEVRGREAGSRLVYEVSDNGRGIDPRDHERIFELFRRSGAQDRPGEGIGLAHVRTLVRRLDGAIACESTVGRGTTFRVSLPRRWTDPDRRSRS